MPTEKEIDSAVKSGAEFRTAEWQEARKAQKDEEALTYLRSKFPGVPDEAFFMDYRGVVSPHVVNIEAVRKAVTIERTCSQCSGKCTLSDRNGEPVVIIEESSAGFKYLEVRWTCGMHCRYDPLSGEFGRMYRASGLISSQLRQTFEAYEIGKSQELKDAMQAALKSAQKQASLILGGRAGTGKTHLAVAMAIYAMKHGRQAIFRLVSEMLDEVREANVSDSERYAVLMRRLKEVPCLVLDDLNKERVTRASSDYLYQIIDYRYRHELQTIITTNARTIGELESRETSQNVQYITPMVSRVLERGAWVTISGAGDYRVKRGIKDNE